jgi:hypothetical protein
VGNLKRRLERLEGGRKRPSVAIIAVQRGETEEEARRRHLAAHPEAEKPEVTIIITGRDQDQDPPCAPPPPRPEPKESAKAPGPAAISITR